MFRRNYQLFRLLKLKALTLLANDRSNSVCRNGQLKMLDSILIKKMRLFRLFDLGKFAFSEKHLNWLECLERFVRK